MKRKKGFSLIEVNMAIFVMAIGVLSIVALFPLGLRESFQGNADLKQSAMADYYLNQVVAIASMTNFPWSQWDAMPEAKLGDDTLEMDNELPNFIKTRMKGADGGSFSYKDKEFKIGCCKLYGHSDRVMGVMIQCTDIEARNYNDYSNNPVFFAQAYFQGDPTK
ncbi:MAG: prepilin-type N-terminal cleavage/methylation domain-containing protein [Kiritimatiellae bacterium]|jgi:Tfp pilus assembly protein PilV|nr:prepilin-type N-terminal cleavage/methylation domain-containing protein [Kiritimatiellia bacterium]